MIKILTKLNAIMADVSYIQKDKKNAHQGYSYASEKAIKEAVHAALVKHKVIFLLSASNPRVNTFMNNVAGKDILISVTLVDCTYRFLDADSGEFVEGTFIGSGSARDDKGNYAAITGAIKYILTSNLLIPTGDDPEGEEEAPAKAPQVATAPNPTVKATAAQITKIVELAASKAGNTEPAKALDAINFMLDTNYKRDVVAGSSIVAQAIIDKVSAFVDAAPATPKPMVPKREPTSEAGKKMAAAMATTTALVKDDIDVDDIMDRVN